MPQTDAALQRQERRWRAGQWLRDVRRAAGVDPKELARHMDITTAQVSNYELGKHEFNDARAEQIARALGLDIVDVRRGLGLWVPESLTPRAMTPEEAIKADPTLRPDQRGMLLALLATVRGQSGSAPTEPDPYDTSYDPDAPPRDDWG